MMIKRYIILPLFMAMLALCASAQFDTHTHTYRESTRSIEVSDTLARTTQNPVSQAFAKVKSAVRSTVKEQDFFNHMDLGVNFGTTGLGLTLQFPMGDYLRLRTGLDYIPRTNVPMTFDLMSYAGTEDNPDDDDDTRFDRLSSLMEDFTGIKIDREVKMNAKGKTLDFKLLIDFFPLKDKRWYGTVGFFWGSSNVGHIENTISEAPSLMGVIMYNKLYDYFVNEEFLFEPIYGNMQIDPEVGWAMGEKFKRYGRVGAHVGDFTSKSPFAEGTPYMLEPDLDGTIHADMYVNHFKPYLGVGFNTVLSKDGRWNLGVDAGALFWGRPSIHTNERYIYDSEGNVSYGTITNPESDLVYGDYIDLAKDVRDIHGKVGTYVGIAKDMHVYPVLNMRITYKLF